MSKKKQVMVPTLLCALCCLVFPAAADDAGETQVIKMQLTNSRSSDLGFGNCQWLYPFYQPPEKLAAEPEYLSDRPIYYTALFGDGIDRTFTMVIDESRGKGTGYDTVYVDRNNNNRIDDEGERLPFTMSSVGEDKPTRIAIELSAGGKLASYYVDFTAFSYFSGKRGKEEIHVNLRDSSYYSGEAVFAGKKYRIAIGDLDSNGLFNDMEMEIFEGDRFFVDLNGDGCFSNDIDGQLYNGYPYAGYTRIMGLWYAVAASPDGGRVEISSAAPPLGRIETSPLVASMELRSETLSCRLEFSNGLAEGIAGSFEVRSLTLKAIDKEGRTWETTGRFPGDACPGVTIPVKGSVRLMCEKPILQIEPEISRKSDSDPLEIGLRISGTAGEIHQWKKSNPCRVKPGYEVRDQSGSIIHETILEYG